VAAGFAGFDIEQRQQSGTNQRGFSAAGASNDCDKVRTINQPIERIGLVFAAEEIFMVPVGERPQPGERMLGRDR
jgi:hypothetical protein